jgi:hypothetical protein
LRGLAGTYEEAQRERTRLQSQVDENRHPNTSITLNQAVERWLDIAKLEDTTRDRYEDLIRIYIKADARRSARAKARRRASGVSLVNSTRFFASSASRPLTGRQDDDPASDRERDHPHGSSWS